MYLQENGNDYRNKSEEVIDRYGFFVSPEELNAEESIDRIVLRRREQKWLEMFASWDVYIGEKFEKLKQRCRKGIPPALRGRAWFYLSSAEFRRKRAEQEYNLENVFEYYSTKQPAANVLNDIEKDLARSFPDHEMFRTDGFGQKGLYDVLKAYAVHDPAVGYCQAQAPIAGILLMHLPAEDAFWVFVQINEEYVRGYFSDGLIAIKEDALATEILVQRICPKGYQILVCTL
ncbi:unnamed protein product [Didymodactylos carnosus]|uniref:Rab-GAP TBC domain-containing protein n=1 Tax=Didymodactylos carnosus TaxID=1234261 RepID=A0A815J8X5_9BILA|nr:unnamed protein product [Didymodactylos carnosus]CAF1373535.1 unnamed protein product [Didymodactylos carnosus]CAF4007786.1 unnamed protein product [Didymodactylos carnosus]CAF4262127.1 unnamed protein product [Didymodactylos carnosus]